MVNAVERFEKSESYEGGDYTNLTIERVRSPRINQQIIDLIKAGNESKLHDLKARGELHKLVREEVIPPGKKFLVYETADGVEMTYSENEILNLSTDENEMARLLEERISAVEDVTGVTFDDVSTAEGNPHTREICVSAGLELKGKRMSVSEMDMVVAHEKDHVIRPYNGPFYRAYFAPGFDFQKMIIPEADYQSNRDLAKTEGVEVNDEEIRASILQYLSTGSEIAERMAQLKNWLRLGPTDMFTKAHLQRAREEYLNECMDNHMTTFLSAVTEETEDEFIRLINSSGI